MKLVFSKAPWKKERKSNSSPSFMSRRYQLPKSLIITRPFLFVLRDLRWLIVLRQNIWPTPINRYVLSISHLLIRGVVGRVFHRKSKCAIPTGGLYRWDIAMLSVISHISTQHSTRQLPTNSSCKNDITLEAAMVNRHTKFSFDPLLTSSFVTPCRF